MPEPEHHAHATVDANRPLEAESEDQPRRGRTPLGQPLMELRREIIASGEPLLDWEDLEREVVNRRGGHEGREGEEANVR